MEAALSLSQADRALVSLCMESADSVPAEVRLVAGWEATVGEAWLALRGGRDRGREEEEEGGAVRGGKRGREGGGPWDCRDEGRLVEAATGATCCSTGLHMLMCRECSRLRAGLRAASNSRSRDWRAETDIP